MIKKILTNLLFILIVLGVYCNVGVVIGLTWVAFIGGLLLNLVNLYLIRNPAYAKSLNKTMQPFCSFWIASVAIVKFSILATVLYVTQRYNLLAVFVTLWLLYLYLMLEIKND